MATNNYPQGGTVNTGIYTGLWANEKPDNWRKTIAKLFPNGDMPLTGLTGKIRTEVTDSPIFNWMEQDWSDRVVAVTGVYTNANLTSAYASGGTAGSILFLKFTDDANGQYSKMFRSGQTVLLVYSSDYLVQKRALVKSVVVTSTTVSYLCVELLEADNSSGNKLDMCNYCVIFGNVNPESGERPSPIIQRPVFYENYCQIIRDSASVSNTAVNTNLRTGNAEKNAMLNAMEDHGRNWEETLLWGIPDKTRVGSNGQPMRLTMGLFYWINTYNPDGVADFSSNTGDYIGKKWTDMDGGWDWLNERLELLFRFGSNTKLCVAGSGAILGINKIAAVNGQFQLRPMDIAFGTKIVEWVTPYGVIMLKTHPLLSQRSFFNHTMVICEPERWKWRPLTNRDTKFIPAPPLGSENGRDARDSEYLTEGGYEFNGARTHGILHNVGVNNTIAV